jgi:tetratricopeptide (TPR) repeat protein
LGASNVYLRALYLAGEDMAREMASFALRYRAARADADAARLLRELARLPAGTKEERFGFLSFLQSEGLLGRDETVAYWDGEALREVRLFQTEIYREPVESDLPPALLDVLGEGIELTGERRLDEAESCFQTVLRQVPDHPVALGNLAAVRSIQGREEESIALLREVVAKHPDYLFARCNLAKTLIFDGQLHEAEALLQGLAERERMHIQDAFALYGSLALLHRAKGEEDSVQSFLRNLEVMVADEDDRDRLAQVRRLLVQLDPERHFEELLKTAAKSRPMPKRPRA